MEKKPIEVNGKYNSKNMTLAIPASLPKDSHYALRVFKEESTAEALYRSTRLMNLEHTETELKCDAPEEVVDKLFEIKNIKTNTVVVTGLIEAEAIVETAKEAVNEA